MQKSIDVPLECLSVQYSIKCVNIVQHVSIPVTVVKWVWSGCSTINPGTTNAYKFFDKRLCALLGHQIMAPKKSLCTIEW